MPERPLESIHIEVFQIKFLTIFDPFSKYSGQANILGPNLSAKTIVDALSTFIFHNSVPP